MENLNAFVGVVPGTFSSNHAPNRIHGQKLHWLTLLRSLVRKWFETPVQRRHILKYTIARILLSKSKKLSTEQ